MIASLGIGILAVVAAWGLNLCFDIFWWLRK